MRLLLIWTVLVAFETGCSRKPARPAVHRLPDTPSVLVCEPPKPTGPTDETLFKLPKDKLYVINGSWMNRHDFTKGDYRRPGEFSFERADNSDVDPKEISEHLNRWIDGSGVRVINQVDSPAGGDRIQRAIDYQTERTSGNLIYVVQPAAPAKKVLVTIEVREHRR
jgi:hypothetical protein